MHSRCRSHAAVDTAPLSWNTRRVSISPVRWTCAAYANRPTRSSASARVNSSASPIFQNAVARTASNPAHTDPTTAVACSMSLIGSMNRTLGHDTDSPLKQTIRAVGMRCRDVAGRSGAG